MRAQARFLALVVLLAAVPAAAELARCPLDLATCLNQFQLMRERPWMGVNLDRDSLGVYRIINVTAGSPAEQAGMQPGDVLEKIGGKPPGDWFAGKAGWKSGDHGAILVARNGRDRTLDMPYRTIPDDVFARLVGVHMVEGHLAYMHAATGENLENH